MLRSVMDTLQRWQSLPPWPLFWALTRAQAFLSWLSSAMLPPPIRMLDIALGWLKFNVVYTAAALGVPDVLTEGPMSLSQLASRTGAKPEALERVMTAANQVGMFTIKRAPGGDEPRYSNNAASVTLTDNHPSAVKSMYRHWHDQVDPGMIKLPEAMRTGEVAWEMVHGKPFFDWLKDKPQENAIFSAAMNCASTFANVEALVADYTWQHHPRLLDIGGSKGTFLASILQAHPQTKGVVFDLPEVINNTQKVWLEKPPALRSRVQLASGSLFDAGSLPEPKSGDGWIMRFIMQVLTGDMMDANKSLIDMLMLSIATGKERSLAQWTALLSQGGFVIKAVHPTRGPLSIIEAVPRI